MRQVAIPLLPFIWIALVLLLAALNRFGKLTLKRRWHPRLTVATNVAFVCFVAAFIRPLVVFMAPAAALHTMLQLRLTRFCTACGATQTPAPPWRSRESCSKCGTRLADFRAQAS